MIVSRKTTTKLGLSSVFVVAILAIGFLVTSTGMIQTSKAAAVAPAGGNTIFKERVSNQFANTRGTSGEMTASTFAFTASSGSTEICVSMFTDNFSTDFFGCGPADSLVIDNGLNSATFSGTITGFDYATGEEKTMKVNVNVDLAATGKMQTTTFNENRHTPDYTITLHESGKFRAASGSLDISGDLSFSTDNASGNIGNVRQGGIDVERV